MAEFEQLDLGFDPEDVADVPKRPSQLKVIQPKSSSGRGCDNCPAKKTWKRGINRVLGKVQGKKIFIFAQSPGWNENNKKKELIGRAGTFLWNELAKVGIEREDCDIQNVMRCLPVTRDPETEEYVMRDPTKEELHCCSIYTERALIESKAKIYLIFGRFAHKEVLGREFRKDRRIFWSDKLQAKVFCLDHPSYFIRGTAPQSKLLQFREGLKTAAEALGQKSSSQFAYLESRDYKGITTVEAAEREAKRIRYYARKKKRRVIVDAEEGTLLRRDRHGRVIEARKVLLCMGFSYAPGRSRTFCLDMPDASGWKPLIPDRRVRNKIREIVLGLLTDVSIRKGCHHGSSDDEMVLSHLAVRMRGYDYDTNYSEYLVYPGRKSYGLEEIAFVRFPQFAGYKMIRYPEAFAIDEIDFGKTKNPTPEQTIKLGLKQGKMNLARLSWKKMVLYNGADCDLTKRLEVSTKKQVKLPLMRVYKDAAYTVDAMQRDGPLMDFKQMGVLQKIFPPRRDALLKKIRRIVGNPDFNPNSPIQMLKFIYGKKARVKNCKVKLTHTLDLPIVNSVKTFEDGEPKPNTQKETLEILGQRHEFPKLVLEFRRVSKIVSTYLSGFLVSAQLHKGRLQTKWWLTGTRSGRMSSGGGGKKGGTEDGIVNLQNVHGDPALQNLIISTRKWRRVYKAWKAAHDLSWIDKDGRKTLIAKLKEGCENWWRRFKNFRIFLMWDQAQVEVRVFAQACGDENLIADCIAGDIHSRVGHAMTGWPVEKIAKDKKTRTLTKNIHFGILFGLSEDGVIAFVRAKDPNSTFTDDDIRRGYRAYFKRYAGAKRYQQRQREFVQRNGYVETLLGYRRPIDTSENDNDDDDVEGDTGSSYWGNIAINSPIQGTAHQLMLIALALLKRKKKTYKKLKRMQLEVHDSVVFNVRLIDMLKLAVKGGELLTDKVLEVVKNEFKLKWKVPLEVEPKAAFRLGTAVELIDEATGNLKTIAQFLSDWGKACHIAELNLKKELESVQ